MHFGNEQRDRTVEHERYTLELSGACARADGARMRVMGEHGVRMICLEPGDVLVFDGDVVHAGAAYRAPNTRVHVYLDVPSVKREHDRTYSYKH